MLPGKPAISSNSKREHVMNTLWNYVLASRVNHLWFALSCLLLLSLSLAMKSQADGIVRVFDDSLEQIGQPMPPQLLPAAVRTVKRMAPAISGSAPATTER
jgi:hypothetical protein